MTTEQFSHRFANPLSSNRVLPSPEESLIRSTYWQTDSIISSLDIQIDKLLLERRNFCDYRQMLANLLSPVRFLPPELLGEIFRYCLPQDYDEAGAHKAVMLPSHVCKRWRDVAFSTPALWTTTVLHVTDETLESRAALVTAWLSRSGSLPLSFTLTGRGNVLPILDFLLQHCARWKYINLSVPLEMLRCLKEAKGHLQRLETMEIDVRDMHGTPPYWVEQIFESAPRLRKVLLSCRFIWNGLNGSWAQLTELDGHCVSYTVGDCLTLLQTARNLHKLRVHIDGEVVEENHRLIFSHPLVSLDVGGTSARWMLFDSITLPNIHDLSVGEIAYESPLSQFISFLTRSSSPLRSFSFGVEANFNELWDNKIVQILQHTPSLHSLCLSYQWPYSCLGRSSIFAQLSPHNKEVDCLIPNLNTISIKVANQFVTPDYQALKEMILERRSMFQSTNPWDTVCEPIQKVIVECFDDCVCDRELWYGKVSAILAPVPIADMVQIVMY